MYFSIHLFSYLSNYLFIYLIINIIFNEAIFKKDKISVMQRLY